MKPLQDRLCHNKQKAYETQRKNRHPDFAEINPVSGDGIVEPALNAFSQNSAHNNKQCTPVQEDNRQIRKAQKPGT